MPGLIDTHIPLNLFDAAAPEQTRRNLPSMIVVKQLNVMEDTLMQGFTSALDADGADGASHPGLQRLYVNYARIWTQLVSDAFVRDMLTNEHAFNYVRVDAVLSSTDGFYKAYGVKPGDGMYVRPEERARLW